MTAEVALAFGRAARRYAGHEIVQWECDWQTSQRLGALTVVPDAHIVYKTAKIEFDAFVEVDRGTEGTRRFARKIARYLDLYRGGSWRSHLTVWPVLLTVAPTDVRGAITSLNQMMIVCGILAAFIVNAILASSGDWRLMLGLAAVAGRSGRHALLGPDEIGSGVA